MPTVFRFVPLLLVVLFVAWCTQSGDRRREQQPLRTELTELFLQQGLISSPSARDGDLDKVAKQLGAASMNRLLWSAAPTASLDALRWIVAHGAEPQNVGAQEGIPLLHKAAENPSYPRLEYFLGLKLDPLQRGRDGLTLLHVAAKAGIDERVLTLLLSKGLKFTDATPGGQLPIHVASVKSIGVLARAGADIDSVDGSGRTPLHQAAADRRADLVAELLRLNASVFKVDRKGRTPLHLAALARSEPVVDALLAAGAPRSARDLDGQTARDLAQTGTSRSRYRDFVEKF